MKGKLRRSNEAEIQRPIRRQSKVRLSMPQVNNTGTKTCTHTATPSQPPGSPTAVDYHITSSTVSQASHIQIQACYFSSIQAQCNKDSSQQSSTSSLPTFGANTKLTSHQNQSAQKSLGLSLSNSVIFSSFFPFAVLHRCCSNVSK